VPVPDDVAPTHLDGLPPEIDADFAASALRDRGASWPERHMAVVAAAMRGYESMVAAME